MWSSLFLCLSARWQLCAKTSKQICIKFSGKVHNGPMNKWLNFGGDPEVCIATLVRHALGEVCTVWLLLVTVLWVFWCSTWGWSMSSPPFPALVHSLPHLLLFLTFPLFPFVVRFTCFLLLSIPSLFLPESSRFVSWLEVVGGSRTWLLFVFILCYLYFLVNVNVGVFLYLV